MAPGPDPIPDQASAESTSELDKEKKQRLLACLREHLQELNPAAV